MSCDAGPALLCPSNQPFNYPQIWPGNSRGGCAHNRTNPTVGLGKARRQPGGPVGELVVRYPRSPTSSSNSHPTRTPSQASSRLNFKLTHYPSATNSSAKRRRAGQGELRRWNYRRCGELKGWLDGHALFVAHPGGGQCASDSFARGRLQRNQARLSEVKGTQSARRSACEAWGTRFARGTRRTHRSAIPYDRKQSRACRYIVELLASAPHRLPLQVGQVFP